MKSQDFNSLSESIFRINKENGWHEAHRRDNQYLILIKSEAFEAFEALRSKRFSNAMQAKIEFNYYSNNGFFSEALFKSQFKDTFEDEIADIVVRILDFAASKKWQFKGEVKVYDFKKNDINVFVDFDRLHCSLYDWCDAQKIKKLLEWCLSVAAAYQFNLYHHIILKMQYNKTRGYKHGNKAF